MHDMNKGVKKGIVGAIVISAVIAFAFYLLSVIFGMPEAEAAEWPFPEPPTIFFGLDYDKGDTFCVLDRLRDTKDHKVVSNLGIRQTLWKKDRWLIGTKYTHHSCSFARDKNGYDGVGVYVEWAPWKLK